MARVSDLERMSYTELVKMETDIERLKIEKQNSERAEVKQKLIDMAKAAGFDIHETRSSPLRTPQNWCLPVPDARSGLRVTTETGLRWRAFSTELFSSS